MAYGVLGFPLVYFVYKYSTPFLGMIDFYQYYKLYRNMDYMAVDSPLNMRLLSSGCVYLMSKVGYFYETRTAIDGSPINKLYFFNAIFFNFLCVVSTCTMIFWMVKARGHTWLFSFAGGMLYLLGFGTIFFELTPLSDALAVLLFSVFLLYYNRRNKLIWIPLLLLIIQREYLLIVAIVITIIDYWQTRHKYYLFALFFTILCFAAHVILRKSIFETPHYSHHTNLAYMWDSLTTLRFPVKPLIRQTLLTMNLCLLYFAIVIYKQYKKMPVDKISLLKIILLLVQILILSFLLALGNNAGRYFYMITPLIIISLLSEVKDLKLNTLTGDLPGEHGN
jgi:hypothetical protein